MAIRREHSGFERFPDTRWSLVRRASSDTPVARRALEDICQGYWGPLYAFVRRSGKNPSDAEDLTQDFVAHLLEKETFARVKEDGGRLRSFLLAALRNFLTDQGRRERAAKRGGGQKPISMAVDGVEALVVANSTERETPETAFEKHWALGLVDAAFARLEKEYAESGREALFAALCPLLQGEDPTGSYAQIGEKLGMREGAVKVAVHRLRQRYRRHFEEVVLETLVDAQELEEELFFIHEVLGR